MITAFVSDSAIQMTAKLDDSNTPDNSFFSPYTSMQCWMMICIRAEKTLDAVEHLQCSTYFAIVHQGELSVTEVVSAIQQ